MSHTPIYRNAGFTFESGVQTANAFMQEHEHPWEPEHYIYSRYRNPTVVACEKQVAQLEDSEWALLTSSGMSAIDLALSMYQYPDMNAPWLFLSEIYGGTHSYLETIIKRRRGVPFHIFQAENGSYNMMALAKTISELKPSVVYFEAVSNPMLLVAEARHIIQMAKSTGAAVIIDNTFATPYLWKPLIDGADLVIHSATKYLSWHGDLTAGVVCGNNHEHLQSAIEYRKWTGCIISPDDASRLSSQLLSFELRMQQHCNNALQLARYLSENQKVKHVIYPGLPSDSSHEQARELFEPGKGFGGMITFELKGESPEDQRSNVNKLTHLLKKSVPLVPTMGEAHTILLPVEPVWGAKYPLPGTIRLSVGIENTANLLDIFMGALSAL